jgi:hypothetical protein
MWFARVIPKPCPRSGRLLGSLACAALLWCAAQTSAASAAPGPRPDVATAAKPTASATLEQCIGAVSQTERSATFAGEMTAIPGSAHLEMRIDVLERRPEEATFHTVSAPGLGVWRSSAPGVKAYRYLKQVTNLSAPAFYRAGVRFRWLNAKGRLMKAEELRTPRCEQPAEPSTASSPTSLPPSPPGTVVPPSTG